MRTVSLLSALVAALFGCEPPRPGGGPLEASEFRLVRDGRTRASLGMNDGGGPSLSLFDESGHPSLRSELDANGQPRVALSSPNPAKPTAVLEVDDKGTHVLFDSPGKGQSYLFQKDDGTAGVVLGNVGGRHRGEMMLSPDGRVDVTLFDGDGGAVFSVKVGRDGAIQRTDR